MGGFNNPVVGALNLIRKAIRSPNYVAGTTGWTINQDGTVEFNSLGGTFQVNNNGLFFYIPNAGTGNLRMSMTNADGTDPYGNTYKAGLFINQRQLWETGNTFHTVLINPDGSTGPQVQFIPSGFNALMHMLMEGPANRLLFEPLNGSNAVVEFNGPVIGTGGIQGSTSFQGSEVTYPVSSTAFTDYTSLQWAPLTMVCPASESIDLTIWFMGHPSTVTANQTITLATRIKQGATTLYAPAGTQSGAMYQSNGVNATTNDVFTAVRHTIGNDILGGRIGQTITFIPSVRITSTGAPNPHIASACISVMPALFRQPTSTFI